MKKRFLLFALALMLISYYSCYQDIDTFEQSSAISQETLDLMPKAVEAQLLNGKSGDFWIIGGMQVDVNGKRASGYAPKKAASNEKPIGQWNRMTIRVAHGELTIKVNGLLQNKATNCPKGPSKFALQVEGDAIDFRNIVIQPLDE